LSDFHEIQYRIYLQIFFKQHWGVCENLLGHSHNLFRDISL
jgi:hypothetical protein